MVSWDVVDVSLGGLVDDVSIISKVSSTRVSFRYHKILGGGLPME